MRITITNDEGEVYTQLRDVHVPADDDLRWIEATDDDGDGVLVVQAIKDAAIWEKSQS